MPKPRFGNDMTLVMDEPVRPAPTLQSDDCSLKQVLVLGQVVPKAEISYVVRTVGHSWHSWPDIF